MLQRARWIRLGLVGPLELHAACAGLAAAQARDAEPIVLWAQARAYLSDEQQYAFAVIAPRRLAPGRPARWFAWALSPAIATYREYGLRAYLNGTDVWLHGRKIAGCSAATIGGCAVIASSFPVDLPAAHAETPPERALEAALRARIEAQYGWQFDSAWPGEAEQAAIAEARADRFVGRVEPAAMRPRFLESYGW